MEDGSVGQFEAGRLFQNKICIPRLREQNKLAAAREIGIQRIREKIREHREAPDIEFPRDRKISKKLGYVTDDFRDDLDSDYRREIVEALEWVLRTVFEVTP